MRLRLTDSWPSAGYRAGAGPLWPRGEVREVSTAEAEYLLQTFPEHFEPAAAPAPPSPVEAVAPAPKKRRSKKG